MTDMSTENQNNYRQASVRGVSFYVDEINGTSGRRAVPHAYPKRETGWTEDNGAVLGKQKIEAFCLGDDYLNQLADLLDALNKSGSCELVHPWWGRQQVQIGEVSHRLTTKVGGFATVSFEVFEAGTNLFPSAQSNTSDEVKESATEARDSNISDFDDAFDAEGLPSYAQESLFDQLTGYTDALQDFVLSLPDLPDEIGDWIDLAESFKDNLGDLLAYPGELAKQITDIIYDVHDLVTTPPDALKVYTDVKNRIDGMATALNPGDSTASGNTSSDSVDEQTQQNSDLITQLYVNDLVIEQAVSLTDSLTAMVTEQNYDTSWSDASNAATLASNVQTSIDDAALSSLDVGMMPSWRSLRNLRVKLRTDINERVLLLPTVRSVTPTTTTPVALLAYQETGSTESRDNIVKRNKLRYPSFITPNDSIEIAEVNNG